MRLGAGAHGLIVTVPAPGWASAAGLIVAVRAAGEQVNDALTEAPAASAEYAKLVPPESVTVKAPARPLPAFSTVNSVGPAEEIARPGRGGHGGIDAVPDPAAATAAGLIAAVRATCEQTNDAPAEAPAARAEKPKLFPSESLTENAPAAPLPEFTTVKPVGPAEEIETPGRGGHGGIDAVPDPAAATAAGLIAAVRATGEQTNEAPAEAPAARAENPRLLPSESLTENAPAAPLPEFTTVRPVGPAEEIETPGPGGQGGIAAVPDPASASAAGLIVAVRVAGEQVNDSLTDAPAASAEKSNRFPPETTTENTPAGPFPAFSTVKPWSVAARASAALGVGGTAGGATFFFGCVVPTAVVLVAAVVVGVV
jgi:hypothetical protein